MPTTLRRHWPEYLMEAGELGTFMIAAGLFTWLLNHPQSPVAIGNGLGGRAVMGLLMAATAICLVHSPWGCQSGAHMNPSFTLAFLRLGKVDAWDAAFYVGAQFAGAVLGITVAALLVGGGLGTPEVRYAATTPGAPGPLVAFAAELVISFVLMLTVLTSSNTVRLARHTPYFVGLLIATYITIESPLSGMSMNPARTFGPAFFGRIWDAWWIYFTAPPLGMLLAAETFVRVRGAKAVWCAKLRHTPGKRCIFRCAYPEPEAG
ncbi:MAG TPA: aquaporin [Vicinamibacterales bacterium]|nr:aquaporin [Vicinamibacterales bacterium]